MEMENLLRPLFEFMSGNLIIINIIVLYGIPVVFFFIGVYICGRYVFLVKNKFSLIVGSLIIIMSLISIGFLSYYCFKVGLDGTGGAGVLLILGALWAIISEIRQFSRTKNL